MILAHIDQLQQTVANLQEDLRRAKEETKALMARAEQLSNELHAKDKAYDVLAVKYEASKQVSGMADLIFTVLLALAGGLLSLGTWMLEKDRAIGVIIVVVGVVLFPVALWIQRGLRPAPDREAV